MKKVLSLILIACIMTACVPAMTFAATEVVVKAIDDDSSFTKTGKWTQSTSTIVVGPDGDKHYHTDDTTAVAQYSAASLEKGTYGVYLYVHTYGTMASLVDVNITASGVNRTITINGMHGGSNKKAWLYLGKYAFEGGNKNEKVTQQINESSTAGQMRTFAVKFIKDDTTTAVPEYGVSDIIISANAPSTMFEKSGNWTKSGLVDPLGGNFIFSAKTDATATYKANSLNGNYGVYWYMDPPSNATDYIDAQITASGQTFTTKLDAKNNGNTKAWVFLGVHAFNGNSADKIVIKKSADADANNVHAACVKFIKDDTNTSRPSNMAVATKNVLEDKVPLVLDTDDFGFFMTGTDWQESSLILTGSQSYFTNRKGDTATWLVNVGKVDGVEVSVPKFSTQVSTNEDSATIYEVYASGKTNQITVDFTVGDVGWYSLGEYNFVGDGTEYIKVIKNTDTKKGIVRAVGIKLALNEEDFQYKTSILEGDEDLHIFERMGMYIPETITSSYMTKRITRSEMAVMLTRLFGKVDDIRAEITDAKLSSGEIKDFSDTATLSTRKTLAWVKYHPEFGIKKKGTNSFSPNNYATKTELVKFILNQLGYLEGQDYTSKDAKSLSDKLKIDTTTHSEWLTPTTMARILASAFDSVSKNGEYTFFEKMVRENGGIKDDSLLDRQPMTSVMKAKRTTAKNKDRDVIYNNDGNDVYHAYAEYPGDYVVTASDIKKLENGTAVTQFLSKRTIGIENTKVNTVFYCTGVTNSYTHITREESAVKGIDTRKRDWSYLLPEYGYGDTLDIMIDTIHGLDKDIFWSMRMNDTHDNKYKFEHLDSWKRENYDKLFSKKENSLYMLYGECRWSSMDYTYQETRQRIYDILKDTVSNYDIDGIELDFTRHPLYFSEVAYGKKAYRENVERMNEFMRMVRALTEKYSMERGKPILVSIYVPDCLDMCYDMGLDVRKWMDEDLFDTAAIGCYMGAFHTWQEAIAEYNNYTDKKGLARIPVYASLDNLCYTNAGLTEMTDYDISRYEAALAYKAGAKGVYTYNLFDINHVTFDTLYDLASCNVTEAELKEYKTHRKAYNGLYCVDSVNYVTINK